MSAHTPRILALATALVVIAGCASQPATDSAKAAERNPYCLTETGTRIEVPEGECAPARGRAVTREELEQTGGVNLSDRLSRLVPF